MKEKAEARWLSLGNYIDIFKEHPVDLMTRFSLPGLSNFPLALNTEDQASNVCTSERYNRAATKLSNIVSILFKCDHIQAVRVDLSSTMLPQF